MATAGSGRGALAQAPLLAGLSAAELEDLEARLRRRRYRKGEVILRQGDPGTTFFLIESGRVRVAVTSPQGKEIILAFRGQGEFLGELSLLDGEPRSADVIAHEASTLLMLDRSDFIRYLESRPKLAIRMLALVGRRLRQSTRMVEDSAFLDIPGRLARVLLDLAESEGSAVSSGTAITSRLTQTELASMVGGTRESVNKWLGSYEREGLLRREGGTIVLMKPDLLRARAT